MTCISEKGQGVVSLFGQIGCKMMFVVNWSTEDEFTLVIHVNIAHPVWSRRVHSLSRPLPCWIPERADSTGSSSGCRRSRPGPACPHAHRTRFECRHRQTSSVAVKTCCRRLRVVYTCACKLCFIHVYVTIHNFCIAFNERGWRFYM